MLRLEIRLHGPVGVAALGGVAALLGFLVVCLGVWLVVVDTWLSLVLGSGGSGTPQRKVPL